MRNQHRLSLVAVVYIRREGYCGRSTLSRLIANASTDERGA
jgi:hypothetical protein